MITLNDSKGLVRIGEWSEIEQRAGFRTDVNPDKHQLAAIIGRYVRPDKVRCGLSNCHSPHARGYLVATKDGLETNIGKDCGAKYFGVDFETLSKQFDRDIEEKERREALWSFSFRIDEIEQHIADLRNDDQGADWVYKKSRPLVEVNQGCPTKVVRQMAELLKSGSGTLQISRVATEAEVEDAEALEGKKIQQPYYILDATFEIQGVEALADENNLRNILILDLEENLAAFRGKNIDELRYEELRRWAMWVAKVDEKLKKAESALALGRKLLIADNLECLKKILDSPRDKTMFDQYLKKLK
jgi:hypothetical protein